MELEHVLHEVETIQHRGVALKGTSKCKPTFKSQTWANFRRVANRQKSLNVTNAGLLTSRRHQLSLDK